MDSFRHEIRENLDGLKATISGIGKILGEAWKRINDHTAEVKPHKDVKHSQKEKIDKVKSELQKTKLLNAETENNIALKSLGRRENLKLRASQGRGGSCSLVP